ncbi:MAG TPA: ACT domain-containing protein, partial [Longimicrobiales bacterium]
CESAHVQVVVRGLPAGMEATTDLLSRLADARVSLDMVSQADLGQQRQLHVTIREDGLADALAICEAAAKTHGGSVEVERGLSRVALVGSGMQNTPGVYARSFRALKDAGVQVRAVGSSAITIIFLVATAHEETAVRVLHEAFDFGNQ